MAIILKNQFVFRAFANTIFIDRIQQSDSWELLFYRHDYVCILSRTVSAELFSYQTSLTQHLERGQYILSIINTSHVKQILMIQFLVVQSFFLSSSNLNLIELLIFPSLSNYTYIARIWISWSTFLCHYDVFLWFFDFYLYYMW